LPYVGLVATASKEPSGKGSAVASPWMVPG
jgi:hypothetical protein